MKHRCFENYIFCQVFYSERLSLAHLIYLPHETFSRKFLFSKRQCSPWTSDSKSCGTLTNCGLLFAMVCLGFAKLDESCHVRDERLLLCTVGTGFGCLYF